MSDVWGTVYQSERDRATGNDPDSLRREIARLRASEEAWKIIAKQNDQWNALPQSEKEAALDKALTAAVAASIQKDSLLERCRTVLGNMAWEREGFWNSLLGRRWPINHEPLRNDARHLLPLVDAEIEGGHGEAAPAPSEKP